MTGRGSRAAALEREVEALQQALARGADGRLAARLGALYAAQGDWRQAARAFRRAARAAPDDPAIHEALARASLAQADVDGLRQAVSTLQRRFPGAPATALMAGHLAKALGELGDARRHYQAALERSPDHAEALYGLVDLGPSAVGSDVAAQAEALAARTDLPPADRINAAFAQGRILDGAGRYAEALEAFTRANGLAREDLACRGVEYERARVDARVAEALAEYPVIEPERAAPAVDLTPIFVVGMPRSGTTLVEQILAAHPGVDAGGELTAALECEREFRQRRRAAGRAGPVEPGQPVDGELLARARERYLDALFERDLSNDLVVDKMPANFRIVGFLRLLFPRAPILHSVRDARATCWSLYSANFGGHEPYYHDMEDLAHYHGQYRRLMDHWRAVVPDMVEVRYEALVQAPEREIPRLLNAAGLDAHPACFEFHRHGRPVFTASHAQVRRPLYTDALEHWRHYAQALEPIAAATT